MNLEAANAVLSSRVAELRLELAKKDEEIRQLQVQMEVMDQIQEVVGNPGDVLNKVRLFDNDVKTKGQLSVAKIIPILVNFGGKMEVILVEMRKLVSGSQARFSQPPLPSPAAIT